MSKHEHRDISFRLIAWSGITFLVAAVLIHIGVWWLFQVYRTHNERRDVRRTLVDEPSPIPPEPRLQIAPQADLAEYLRSQREILNSYGWASREQGRVRIPITRAMELAVEQEKK
ncbi:MAG TPA: hypothetical protein VE422_31220 [Terriglobia bacterium]|nr:hypothetical protein [Terriglobia bacterium]